MMTWDGGASSSWASTVKTGLLWLLKALLILLAIIVALILAMIVVGVLTYVLS